MSWFKHETENPSELSYKRENSQVSAGGSFFTDPQSYNENSRAVKARSAMSRELKNDFLMQQQLTEKKREEKLEAKRFNPERVYENQVNERRDLDEKQEEKLRKLAKQREYQDQLHQQMQDNFNKKQAQRAQDYQDSGKWRSPFNSGAPQNQRDITNQEQLEALEVEKRNRKEKQDQYARQLSAQLDEQHEKKMLEKHHRRQPNPGHTELDSLDKLKREQAQNKRDYAESLQDHMALQSHLKQQQKEKERSEAQSLTGLDIKGSYKFNGPSKQQMREDLAAQIQQKEYVKQKESQQNPYERNAPVEFDRNPYEQQNQYADYDRNPYEKNAPVDYDKNVYEKGAALDYGRDPYEKNAPVSYDKNIYEKSAALDYGRDPYEKPTAIDYDMYYAELKKRQENAYGGGYQEQPVQSQAGSYGGQGQVGSYGGQGQAGSYGGQVLAGKGSGVKENAGGLDIFGNPTRVHQKPVKQGGDFDIFGNPVKRR